MSGAAERLRIGEVAKLAGTTPRTIRYYEEIGLLPVSRDREAGAHRSFEVADVERLTELLRVKELLGLSLEEMKRMFAAETARDALDHLAVQLDLVRRRKSEIETLEAELLMRRRAARALLGRSSVGAVP